MCQLFASGGQSIGASASVLPMNIQSWSPLGLTDLILLSKGLLRVFSSTTDWKASVLWHTAFFMVQLSHPYMTWKNHSFDHSDLCRQTGIYFLILSRFVIAILPRSKCLLIAWLQSPSTLTLEPKMKSDSFHIFPIYLPWSDGIGCHDLSFLNAEF